MRLLAGVRPTAPLRRIDDLLAAAARQLIRPQAEREAREAAHTLAEAIAGTRAQGNVSAVDRLKVGALLAMQASASFAALAKLTEDAMDNHMALVWDHAAASAETLIEEAAERRAAEILQSEQITRDRESEEEREHQGSTAEILQAQIEEAGRLAVIAETVGRAAIRSPGVAGAAIEGIETMLGA